MITFRALGPGETRILFLRHGEHEKQVIVKNDADMIRIRGEVIAKTGLKIKKHLSSPAARALRSGLLFLEGAGQTPLTYCDARFGDAAMDLHLDITAVKADAKQAGVEPEAYLLTAEQYVGLMDDRGLDGAHALRNAVETNIGKTVLVSSHGRSGMEVALLALLGENNYAQRAAVVNGSHMSIKLVERGQIVEVLFGAGGLDIRYITDADLGLESESKSEGLCSKGCM